jgi:hypothetical protein
MEAVSSIRNLRTRHAVVKGTALKQLVRSITFSFTIAEVKE